MRLQTYIDRSIALLQRAEKIALRMSDKGFYLAFSGGKDSQVLYHLAQEAGVRFEAHYTLTTLDPPELVRFIRTRYPDVIVNRPPLTFLQLCEKKKTLPTMSSRFCCSELKESRGRGMVTLTGVRRAESAKRAKRNEVEILGHKFTGTIDEFERREAVEHSCVGGKDRLVVSPIIDWPTNAVWSYIRGRNIEYCELYDQGWHRLGCLFCPMASLSDIRRMERRYPRYRAAFIRLIHRMRANGWAFNYAHKTDEQLFEMWISKKKFAVAAAEQDEPKLFEP